MHDLNCAATSCSQGHTHTPQHRITASVNQGDSEIHHTSDEYGLVLNFYLLEVSRPSPINSARVNFASSPTLVVVRFERNTLLLLVLPCKMKGNLDLQHSSRWPISIGRSKARFSGGRKCADSVASVLPLVASAHRLACFVHLVFQVSPHCDSAYYVYRSSATHCPVGPDSGPT